MLGTPGRRWSTIINRNAYTSMDEYPEYPCGAFFLRKALRENGRCCTLLTVDGMADIIVSELGIRDAAGLIRELHASLASKDITRPR